MSTHFQGPLAGSLNALGGAGKDVPIHGLSAQDWAVFFNDFHNDADYDATNDWTLTQVTGGSAALQADLGGRGLLRLDAPAQNQGPSIQRDGAGSTVILPVAATATNAQTEAVFAARFAATDVSGTDAFVGLAESGAAVMSSAGALTVDTHAGFHVTVADAGAFRCSAAGSDDTNAATIESVFTLSDAEYVDVAVRITGTLLAEFYYRLSGSSASRSDGKVRPWTKAGTIDLNSDPATADAWDAAMYPTLALIGDGAADDLDVDWVLFAVRRDRSLI